MVEWEKFSVFGDVGELEHVSYLLELAAKENREDLGDLIGENSYLVQKLNAQNKHSETLIERERPGLYPRTWMAHLFTGLYVLLDELLEAPRRLPDTLPRLLLDLHKVLIAAHDVFDPYHRAVLVAGIAKAHADGVAQAKNEQSQKARNAVKQRTDQVIKSAFMVWAKAAVAAGKSVDTIDTLQSLAGFDCGWSQMGVVTLKAWAREAGFTFKTGRPKKKK